MIRAEDILSGNRSSLSRAITLVESSRREHRDEAGKLLRALMPHTGQSVRIGITGSPGVGKSTLIEKLGMFLVGEGKKPAVLAVDPSSSRSRGSILGDKTRMPELSASPEAYIRPTAAGVTLGGVHTATREAMLLCEAAGFDVIIVETVGVGQSETAVRDVVDCFVLMVLPGAGDELQGIKRGIVELADILLIHKADTNRMELAKQARRAYQNALHLFPGREDEWQVPLLLASSQENSGILGLWDTIQQYIDHLFEKGVFDKQRKNQNITAFDRMLDELFRRYWMERKDFRDMLESTRSQVRTGELSPMAGAFKIWEYLDDVEQVE